MKPMAMAPSSAFSHSGSSVGRAKERWRSGSDRESLFICVSPPSLAAH